jgi:hypothetical protein
MTVFTSFLRNGLVKAQFPEGTQGSWVCALSPIDVAVPAHHLLSAIGQHAERYGAWTLKKHGELHNERHQKRGSKKNGSKCLLDTGAEKV